LAVALRPFRLLVMLGGAGSEGIVGEKVRWGDVEIVPYMRVRHLTFSSKEGVSKPGFGEAYSGIGREKE